MERRKTLRDGLGLGLGWLPINDFPHNSQPKIGVRDGGEYEGEIRLGESARRGCLSIVLAALSSNNIIKPKYIVELTNCFSRLDH
jgi:hypothetical protein